MIKMSRKAKKAMAVALTAGMLASTAVTPVMAATQGWKQNSKGWWYQNADGSYPANKWSQINGKWYYFDANGYMLANKWVKDSAGKWYYVGKSGAMLTNAWIQGKDGLWYWVTDNGSMKDNGWGKINGEWYFFKNDGVMQSGVVKVDGKTYYLGLPSEGWMHTGVVTINGVDYNFDKTNGDCTDEKGPVAEFKFDKKGNPIKEDIDVEEIDGVNAEVVNAIPQYAEYGSVVMTGDDAVIKVKVTNNGKPVAGTAVTLTLKYETGDDDDYESKSGAVSITDANGYAPFVVGADFKQSAVNGCKALYSYKATAVTSGEVYEGKLAFATIKVDDIKVDPDTKDKLEISTNAVSGDNSIETTIAMDGETVISYVKSQQVSLPNSDEHKVTFELNPELVIPVAKGKDVVSEYDKEINQTLGEYSVYENNEFWVKDIPAGIEYGTLNLENIDISENTKVVITTYKGGKTEDKDILNQESITGPKTDKNAKYQLPKVDDKTITTLDVKIQILSEGQVNDGQNGGLTVKNVTGIYKQEGATDNATVALTNPITWEKTEIAYSLEQKLENPKAYISELSYPEYISDKYSYTYQVPVFPYVGNAIITVKDSNKKVLGYFTTPTKNEQVNGKHKNVNVLTDTGRPEAILVTKDEAFNSVGTITPNGNRVTVNSDKTGVTAFKAKITINDEDYDLTNDTINTSVHWSPIPSGVEAEDEFYALSGQKIVVKAQLVDKAGNKVSQSNENVTFYYNNAAIAEGSTGNLVTALSVKGKTDSEGRAYLELRATDVQAVLSGLTANSKNAKYDVVLVIGDQTVNKATLRWVTPGLKFNPDVDAPATDVISTLDAGFNNEVSKDYISKYLTKDSGSQWIFGYAVNGDTQDDKDTTTNKVTVDRKVSSIEGLKINISQDGEATLVTEGMKNGAAKVSSANAYGTKLTGKINESSLTAGTDVIFHVVKTVNGESETVDYKNVGEGTPYFEKDVALTLPVSFGEVGTKMEIVAPLGNRVVDNATNKNVYAKITDNFGKPYANKDLSKVVITYTVTDGAKTETVAKTIQDLDNNILPSTKLTTGTKGTVAIPVQTQNINGVTTVNPSNNTVVKADVKVYCDDVDADCQISFVDNAKAEKFLLLNAEYDVAGKKAVVTFNHEIANKEISKDMVLVLDSNKRVVGISNVEKSGKTLTINFTEALDTREDYTVELLTDITSDNNRDVDKDGVPDYIYDANGMRIDSSLLNNKLTVNSASLEATYNENTNSRGSETITFKVNKQNVTTNNILCVYTDSNNSLVAVLAGNNALSLSDTGVTEVTCYYNGAKEVITLDGRKAEIQAARNAIAGVNFNLTEAAALGTGKTYSTVNGGATVTFVDAPDDFKATIAKTDAGSIFAEPTGSASETPTLALATSKVTDLSSPKTATITLTYTHDVYKFVKKKVTYKVTLSDTTNTTPTVADTIKFELQ